MKPWETWTRGICAMTLVVVLTACAVPGGPPELGNATDVHSFVENDLQVALESAQAYDDQIAALCWSSLLKWKQENPIHFTAVVGAASAYQKVRNTRRILTNGLPDEVKIGCAPMLFDSPSFIRRLAQLASGVL